MQVNFDATEPVNEEITDAKQVIPFAQYAISRAIDHFGNRKFAEAATVCYKAYCLLNYLRFVLPVYPRFASIYSFASVFLASAYNIINQMLQERFFQTPLNNTRDALFDPMYSFTEQFSALPAEFCYDLQTYIAETLFSEVKRILMRQKKEGRIAIDGTKVMFQIAGFQGTFQWVADYLNNLYEAHQMLTVEDFSRVRVMFGTVEAHPVDERLAQFVGAMQFQLDDKYGDNGMIFSEIKEKVSQMIIIRQYYRIVQEQVPQALDGRFFVFQKAQGISAEYIKNKVQRPVYALVYRFPKETIGFYTTFAAEQQAVFSSKTTEFADLICLRPGKPTIRLEQLGKSRGPSDYLIFYFKYKYEEEICLTCGENISISFLKEEAFPVSVIDRLAAYLTNLQKNEQLHELYASISKIANPARFYVYLQEDMLQLCCGRLNVRISDVENIGISDFLTGNDVLPLYTGLLNSGIICTTAVFPATIDAKMRLGNYIIDKRPLFLYEIDELEKVVAEIDRSNLFFNLFCSYTNLPIYKPKFGYFYSFGDYITFVQYTNGRRSVSRLFYDYLTDGELQVLEETQLPPNAQEYFADSAAKVYKVQSAKLIVTQDDDGVTVSIRQYKGQDVVILSKTPNASLQTLQHCKNLIVLALRKVQFVSLLQERYYYDPFDYFAGYSDDKVEFYQQARLFSQEFLINYALNNGLERYCMVSANKDILVANLLESKEPAADLVRYLRVFRMYSENHSLSLSLNIQISLPQIRYCPLAPFLDDEANALRLARNLSNGQLELADVTEMLADQRNFISLGLSADVVISFATGVQAFVFRTAVEDMRRALREQLKVQLQALQKKQKAKTEAEMQQLAARQAQWSSYLARIPEGYDQLFFVKSPYIIYLQRCDVNFDTLVRQAQKYMGMRGVLLRQALQAIHGAACERELRTLMAYVGNIAAPDLSFVFEPNSLALFDQHLRLLAYEQQLGIYQRVHTFLMQQVAVQSTFQLKPKYDVFVLKWHEMKAPELQGSKLKFQTRSRAFSQFLVDLGAFDGQVAYNLLFDPPSISLSLNTTLSYQSMQVDVSKVLKQLVRRFSCGMFFSCQNEFNPFITLNLAFFDQAQARFQCGEKPARCDCVNCVVSDRQIQNYQNKCRCGDHHCVPFGHGMLPMPQFKELAKCGRFLAAVVKVGKVAATLNYLQAAYEMSGALRLFQRADSTIAGRDSDSVKFLTLKGFDWLKINAAYDNDSCLCIVKQRQLIDTDVNQLVRAQFGFDGVVYGTTCFGWAGQLVFLRDGKWAQAEDAQSAQDGDRF